MPPIVNCLKRASLKAALLEIFLKSLKKRIPLLVTSNYSEKEQEKKRDYIPVFAPIIIMIIIIIIIIIIKQRQQQ